MIGDRVEYLIATVPKATNSLYVKIDLEHYLAPEKVIDAMPKRTMETTSIAGNGEDLH